MKANLTLAQSGNVNALGYFCAIAHLYAIGVPHSKIGFMKDFFDQARLDFDSNVNLIRFTKNRHQGRYGYLNDVYDITETTPLR